jgi:hypothetical protein
MLTRTESEVEAVAEQICTANQKFLRSRSRKPLKLLRDFVR